MAHIAKYQAHAIGGMCAHYARVPERERGFERDNIDRSRTGLNYNLAPEHEGGQVQFISDRIASLDLKRKPRKDAVVMCDLVLTMPKDLPDVYERRFFTSAAMHLSEKFGAQNVVSAWVHVDETTRHMHFAWVPVTEDGRLSAKSVVNRKMLKTLHTELQGAISADLGRRVELVLDEEKKADKALSGLDHDDYVKAKKQLDRMNDRLAATAAEIDIKENQLNTMRVQVLGVEDELAQAQRDLESTRAMADGEADRLERLQRLGAATQERIIGIEKETAELGSTCSRLEQLIERSEAALKRVMTAIADRMTGLADVLGIDLRGDGERFFGWQHPTEARFTAVQAPDRMAEPELDCGADDVFAAARDAAVVPRSERTVEPEWQR